jgi:choloylglycine hydrolase
MFFSSLFIGLWAESANACTRIFWNNNGIAMLSDRTWDLYFDDTPQILTQPRGIKRNGLAGNNSKEWTSIYGSFVVSVFGQPEAVADGMNEKGLAVHCLYLHGTQYELRNSKPAVNYAVFLQYILDNAANVSEAVALLNDIQVVPVELKERMWPLHYSFEDASGDSAIIEWVNGEMKVYHDKKHTVMANEPAFDVQLNSLPRYAYFGGKLPLPGDVDSGSRFVRASAFLKTLPKPETLPVAKQALRSAIRSVAVPKGAEDTSGTDATDTWETLWVTSYDLTNLTMGFDHYLYGKKVELKFKDYDFSKGASVVAIYRSTPVKTAQK